MFLVITKPFLTSPLVTWLQKKLMIHLSWLMLMDNIFADSVQVKVVGVGHEEYPAGIQISSLFTKKQDPCLDSPI